MHQNFCKRAGKHEVHRWQQYCSCGNQQKKVYRAPNKLLVHCCTSPKFWAHLFSVIAVPVRPPGFPKPPPSPPLEVQLLRAIPDTTAKPRIYRETLWAYWVTSDECKLHTVKIKRVRKMGSLTLFFGWNRPPLYGIFVSSSWDGTKGAFCSKAPVGG